MCIRDRFGKVWFEFRLLISVCEAWQWRRKKNLHRVGKNGGRVWSRLWTKVHDILGRCRRPIVVVRALDRLSNYVSFQRYKPLKWPLNCKFIQKRWLSGPRFVGGGDTLDFGHAFSNHNYFRPCGRFCLSFVQQARRLGSEKRERKEKKERKNPR